MTKGWTVSILLGILVGCATPVPDGAEDDYSASIRQWRDQRLERLVSETGYLTLAGLYWLENGSHTFGTDPSNDIVLPEGTTSDFAGAFDFADGTTTVRIESGVPATVDGEPLESMVLASDEAGEPDAIVLGDRLTMYVIKRGDRFGIRLQDKKSRYREEFAGLAWFPIQESYRVTGRFVPYDPPREVAIADVTGNVQNEICPGKVVFELGGREVSLEPVQRTERLFYVFSDTTSGEKTYGSGRFLYSDLPEDGRVELDFNKAYNPPCAFTPYSTCPLPTQANQLPVPVEAGELDYRRH